MSHSTFLSPGIVPRTYYKVKLQGKAAWDVKLFGHLVRHGQDSYKMNRLLDQKRFQNIRSGSALDHILRTRSKDRWFDIDYDQIHNCFFLRSSRELPILEEHSDISSGGPEEFRWWPSNHVASNCLAALDHALRDWKNGEVWLKKEYRDRPKVGTPEEMRLFSSLIGFQRIRHLFVHPKDLLFLWYAVGKDRVWEGHHCDLDFRRIHDGDDRPLTFTDFRVPRGTILGCGEWERSHPVKGLTFAVTIAPENGVQQT